MTEFSHKYKVFYSISYFSKRPVHMKKPHLKNAASGKPSQAETILFVHVMRAVI